MNFMNLMNVQQLSKSRHRKGPRGPILAARSNKIDIKITVCIPYCSAINATCCLDFTVTDFW